MLVNTIMSLPDDINLMNSEQVRFYLMTNRMSCEINYCCTFKLHSSVNNSDHYHAMFNQYTALKDT